MKNEKVQVVHEELLRYLSNSNAKYNAIFIDLPDPRSVNTNQYYTLEFYYLIRDHLEEDGLMITQAGNPYFATHAFFAIGHTMEAAGFNILPIHNQILTLGEWGWYVGSDYWESDSMKEKLLQNNERTIETRWFNDEAARLITSFGKTYSDTLHLQINTLDSPSVHQYYLKGNWNLN